MNLLKPLTISVALFLGASAAASGDGRLGTAWGVAVREAEIQPEGGAVNYSKYLTIWRRMPDGTARFVTDGGNTRPATP